MNTALGDCRPSAAAVAASLFSRSAQPRYTAVRPLLEHGRAPDSPNIQFAALASGRRPRLQLQLRQILARQIASPVAIE